MALTKGISGASAEDLLKYPDLRKRALGQRGIAATSELLYIRELCLFWKSFLTSAFNVQIYNDFRSFALEDARQPVPNIYGLEKLLGFYRSVLGDNPPVWMQDKPYPSILLQHELEAQQLSQSIRANRP